MLGFDLSGATVGAASWGLCVFSLTANVLDYRSFARVVVSDVAAAPQRIAISSAGSLSAGDLLWFSATTPCVSPASAAQLGAGSSLSSPALFAASGGTPWALCAGPPFSLVSATAYDSSDASVIVSDLVVSPERVHIGAAFAVSLSYSVGMLLPWDSFYFLDERTACDTASPKRVPVAL